MERWTKKQLNSLSDLRFAQAILQERRNGLTNPYSPLALKLGRAAAKLDELAAKEEAQVKPTPQPKQYKSYEEVFEDLGWTCYKCDDGTLELEKYSPAGEDFIFTIAGEEIPKKVADYARDFDADLHVDLWMEGRGKRGVPDSWRVLIEDAGAIQEMLNELAEALATVKTNCDLGTYDCATCIIHENCDREEEGGDDNA